MRRALLIIVPLAGAIAIGAVAAKKAGGCSCPPGECTCRSRERGGEGRERRDIWARMEEKMAQMPETFPPRVMFDNIAAIREQTTRILELLERDGDAGSKEAPEKAAD